MPGPRVCQGLPRLRQQDGMSSISWLLRFKRLGLRYDRTERTLAPLLTLGMVLINLRRLVEAEF